MLPTLHSRTHYITEHIRGVDRFGKIEEFGKGREFEKLARKLVGNFFHLILVQHSLPNGQKFPKSAHGCCVFYAISADFDANRRKNNNF